VSLAVQPLRSAPASQGKVQAIRTQMATTPGPLRLLLKQVGALDLQIPADHPLELALATLGRAYDERNPGLMPWEAVPFPQAQSASLEAARTPAERLAAYEVATAMLLKRSLRNGSVSAPHSVDHRSVADQLMPIAQWQKARPQAIRDNRWTTSIDTYLHRFEEALSLRATMLDEAIEAGELSIADGRFRIPKLEALPKDPVVDQTRAALFAAIGSVQLPDVIVATDAHTSFSSLLLGRDAAGKEELEALYAALLAMGTDKTAAEMARMVDGVSDDRIELAMRAVEENGHLRTASDAVAAAMLAHPIAAQWGSGVAASADMMSLDATRKLWLARIEPRRRGPAVGTYTHVSDRWAVIYDQPVLLNERQAGVAIEGALKQKVCELGFPYHFCKNVWPAPFASRI
jgi:Tn3 transposase DDE domain